LIPLSAAPWEQGQNYRSPPVEVSPNGRPGFEVLPPANTGIFFTNHLSKASAATNRVFENGSGVALGDIDGDGWCDIYFCGMEGENVLYRNLGGWKFEDITQTGGVACSNEFCTGAVFADADGDRDLDLFVTSIGGGARLFSNDGKGRFSEISDSGLASDIGATSMALADIDGDADLDLYVASYRATNYKDAPPGVKPDVKKVDGKFVAFPEDRFIVVPSRRTNGVTIFEMGEADVLYRNDGKGRFIPISWTNGDFLDEDGKRLAHPPYDWGLSVMFRDINGDGAPDIYVCNDFQVSRDTVWINDGKGRFKAIDKLALRSMSMSSMGIDFADINRDGFEDFFVVDMLSRDAQSRQRQRANVMKGDSAFPIQNAEYRPEIIRNTLHLNRGDGTYAEIACLSGLEATEWSWCPIFLDVDLDGFEDLLVTTGNLHDVIDADTIRKLPRGENTAQKRYQDLLNFPTLEAPNLAFRNNRDLTFSDVSADWGFNAHGISQGMALADLDNDGDLDVVVNNMNAPAGLYRNRTSAGRVAVRLKGLAPNTQGIGAKIKVSGGPVIQSQEIICGGRYLSNDDPIRVFATTGRANRPGEPPLTIEVIWRSGKRSVVANAKPNRLYEIDEAGATASPATPVSTPRSLFEDVSRLLSHKHHESTYDDFQRQPLLGERLSEGGPGIAWHDLDGDGWDDLIIGAGKGGQLSVFRNDQKGAFAPRTEAPFTNAVPRDLTSVLAWSPDGSALTVLAGLSNWEEGLTTNPAVRIYNLQSRSTQDALVRQLASTGPLALGDIDGDGHLECFVGGRMLPGRYPEPASSRLYQNVGGQLRIHRESAKALDRAGLVNAAVFTDLRGAGYPDLVLACDWGPIRVFRQEGSAMKEVTQELGLDKYLGRWNGVTSGDFDGDGRLDIAASNWGRNTKYQRYLARPLRLLYADFAGAGTVQTIEAFFDKQHNKWFPWRDFETMTAVFPPIRDRFNSFRAYGGASVEEIFGEALTLAKELRVNTLDSMLFLNRTNTFEAVPLPIEAQFAPAFGLAVNDFDGDGHEDIFLAQNFFAVEPETPRYDAGRGLLLRGTGSGKLVAVPGQESGIKIYGEQRGCAAADYDGDGRVDLAVGQNGSETKLYRNVTAPPGLRVRLKGPPANPHGVGAIIRPSYSGHSGAAREIHAGAGYWSQDSAVQIFSAARGSNRLDQLSVRWPGGKLITAAVEPGAKEVAVDYTSAQ
jgi:hypothetical protein